MTDSIVKCKTCGREERVSFGDCLRSGWPKCCGYTMALITEPSAATVDAAVAGCVGIVGQILRREAKP